MCMVAIFSINQYVQGGCIYVIYINAATLCILISISKRQHLSPQTLQVILEPTRLNQHLADLGILHATKIKFDTIISVKSGIAT